MYTLIIIIHVIACVILIAAILLQSGRGAGVSELFGASSSQTIFGTRASTFLTRATTGAAIAFLLTCITLTVFSSRRLKSLMSGVEEPAVSKQSLPQGPPDQGVSVEIEEEAEQEQE